MPQEEMMENSTPDLTAGYCIKIEVLPDGFTVSDPLPLEEKQEESAELEPEADTYEQGELIADQTSLLKNILAVIKENPVSGGEEAGFEEAATE